MNGNWLFKVCHRDGSEWTMEEVRKYLGKIGVNFIENGIMSWNVDGFAIDESGNLMITDTLDKTMYIYGYDFKIVWNKELIK